MKFFIKLALLLIVLSAIAYIFVDKGSQEETLLLYSMLFSGIIMVISLLLEKFKK